MTLQDFIDEYKNSIEYKDLRDKTKQHYNYMLRCVVNYFEDLVDPWGGVEVKTPKRGDIIYFQIQSDIPNHCGVYLGEDKFIHARRKHLSCTDFLPRWKKYIKSYIRCKKFI